jgi:hypothetical protein
MITKSDELNSVAVVTIAEALSMFAKNDDPKNSKQKPPKLNKVNEYKSSTGNKRNELLAREANP